MAFGSIAPSYDPMTGLPIGVPDVVPTGQLEEGNIDLTKRPVVRNPDGSISTVLTKGFNFGGPEVNIPTVGHDGTILSDADAIRLYKMSGKHLGKFDTPEHAGAAAAQLHEDQAALYAPPPRFGSIGPYAPMSEDPAAASAPVPDWRDREAQAGLALQQADKLKAERKAQSWGSLAREIPGNLLEMAKGLVAPAAPADPNAPPSLGPAAFGTMSPGEAALQPETTGGRVIRGVGNMMGEAAKSGFTAPHDAMTGDILEWTPEGHTSPEMVQRGFDTAALAGGASAAGTAERVASSPGVDLRVMGKQLASDSGKPGAVVAAAEHAPPFYSHLEQAVTDAPIKKATGDQWLGTLSNKPGVKPEEMDWTGLRTFLKEKADQPVTKEEVAAHIGENKVQLGEVTKGSKDPAAQVAFEDYHKELAGKYGVPEGQNVSMYARLKNIPADEITKYRELQDAAVGTKSDTKYLNYQLPGGENYREKLLTMPEAGKRKTPGGMDVSYDERGNDLNYKSSHWDEPNVLVHRRTNERDVGGVPSLHVEELQSDWHQAGRKSGYRPEQEKRLADLVQQRDGMQKEASVLPVGDARRQEIYRDLPKLQTEINDIGAGGVGVPDAPFKKTEAWTTLGLKDAIREAAEKGIDRISITPGEAQAARYSLAKQFNQITVVPTGDGGKVLWPKTVHGQDGGSITVDASGKVVKANRDWGDIVGKNLDDAVGKDVADRAMKAEKETKLSGVDLSVGGEGMKGFYDKMVPDALNKIGKPHGVKVQSGTSGSHYSLVDKEGKPGQSFENKAAADAFFEKNPQASEYWDLKKDDHPVHYMDIPPSLKEQALKKGFSLFEDTGAAAKPLAALEHAPISDPHGFGPLDVHPNERALTVNDILAPETPKMKPGSRDVETIAKELMDRGSSALEKMGVEGGRIEKSAPHTDELLSRGIASEIKAAMGRGNSASDWYTKKISEAMDIAGEMHPELKNDPHQKMGFTSALAITSQGEAVTSNVRLANQVYEHFKKTGRFPETVEAKNGPAMGSNFRKMNALLDNLGPEGTKEFLHKEFTVKELEGLGYDVGGENKQTKVYGSSILGPKIGQGFYQNLNGNYKPVTMDLWFMRAWGRMTGTLVGKTDLSKPIARLQEAMKAEGMKVPKDPEGLATAAREAVLKHERDFRADRPSYDSGKKKKSELTYAAERYEKNATGINEQPTSGSQRQWMRDVVNRSREILEDHGHKVTNADLQAIWWYPEKELYSKLGGRDSDKINIDYATAFRDLKNKGAVVPEPAAAVVHPPSGGRPADKADVTRASAGSGKGSKKAARQKVSSFGSLAPGMVG